MQAVRQTERRTFIYSESIGEPMGPVTVQIEHRFQIERIYVRLSTPMQGRKTRRLLATHALFREEEIWKL